MILRSSSTSVFISFESALKITRLLPGPSSHRKVRTHKRTYTGRKQPTSQPSTAQPYDAPGPTEPVARAQAQCRPVYGDGVAVKRLAFAGTSHSAGPARDENRVIGTIFSAPATRL